MTSIPNTLRHKLPPGKMDAMIERGKAVQAAVRRGEDFLSELDRRFDPGPGDVIQVYQDQETGRRFERVIRAGQRPAPVRSADLIMSIIRPAAAA